MSNALHDKVALVTGAGAGLGRAQAIALARDGATVVVQDRDADGATTTAAAITRAGGQAEIAIGDIADIELFQDTISDIERRLGTVDILVNNAAIGGGEALEDVTRDRFDALYRTNARAPFFATQAVVPGMKRRGWGRIVNVSSLIAVRGAAGNPHYAGLKAALLGFTRAWALEFAAHGITVNTVVPPFIKTPMATAHFDDAEFERRAAAHPMGRLATPEDVAHLVCFLASPAASLVTGQTISPNGGEFVGAM